MPKGNISPKLAAVLRDRSASHQLRNSISDGKPVTVRVEGKNYRVSSKGTTNCGEFKSAVKNSTTSTAAKGTATKIK